MLSSRLLSSFFGSETPPQTLTVGLLLDGREVDDAGYQRQRVRRGSWQVRDDQVSARVSFGPFDATRRFNAVAVFDGDDLLDVSRFADTVTVIPGMVFDAQPTIDLKKIDG